MSADMRYDFATVPRSTPWPANSVMELMSIGKNAASTQTTRMTTAALTRDENSGRSRANSAGRISLAADRNARPPISVSSA